MRRRHSLMEKEMVIKVVENNCPFAQRTHMRFREIEEGEGTLTLVMEDDPANLNAFGLVHAGAMCGLAETVGGMALMRYVDPTETIVLNTVLNIRFTHPPRGELTCMARVTQEEADILIGEVEEKGRADKAMDLKILDSSGTMVAHAQATFRLLPTPDEYKEYFGG
jgi:uncharacterized protein (TIGR00369 family)